MRPRPSRVAVPGANLRFANTSAELLNVSPTGALIRLGFKPRVGGEWPMAIDLPARGQVWVNGRVVRCELGSVKPDVTRAGTGYLLGLAFVQPSERAQVILDQICGAATPTAIADVARRTNRVRRLRRLSLSLRRQCPECHSTAISKETGHRYS